MEDGVFRRAAVTARGSEPMDCALVGRAMVTLSRPVGPVGAPGRGFRNRDPGPALRSDPGYSCLAVGADGGGNGGDAPWRSLVILVAWWFKSPVRTLFAKGAESAKESRGQDLAAGE